MARITGMNFWKTLLGIVAGSIIGTIVGELTSGVPGLSWLSRGSSVGINPPFSLDLGFLSFTFGFTMTINLAVIIFIVVCILLFRKIF